jgi:hypothetical protein
VGIFAGPNESQVSVGPSFHCSAFATPIFNLA